MKSKLFLFLFLTVFTLNVYAHGGASAIYGVKWTPVNIVSFPIAIFNPGETEVAVFFFLPA